MYKPTKQAEGMDHFPGVPFEETDDEVFKARVKDYAERNDFSYQSLLRSGMNGYFEHVPDKQEEPAKAEAPSGEKGT